MTIKAAESLVGGLSRPSKMPGFAYGLPASRCKTGSILRKQPGTVCSRCYACKGRYSFQNTQVAQERRFEALSDPGWTDSMIFLINTRKMEYFRWHDSGDIQDTEHLEKIVKIATECPNTKFWLPTKESRIVKDFKVPIPENLVIRVSATKINGAPSKHFMNTSTVVTNGAYTCPAPEQGGSCGPCRKCWDSTVKNIAYKEH